jgi:ABC-type transporter Mla maintaining outer membrane lipid asymmetry ATPase subunit MlaF
MTTGTVSTQGEGQPLLSLRGITKSFGAVDVLKGVDLDCYLGQVTALVGDNGAGKSTLVKGIAGTYTFDGGSYLFAINHTGIELAVGASGQDLLSGEVFESTAPVGPGAVRVIREAGR